MTANTINLNIKPYYDDFDENKNFYRILFNPGQAVQARELTQIQSSLQDQVVKFADHIFQEGSIVKGIEPQYLRFADYVQLRDTNASGTQIDVSDFANVSVSAASGVAANVITTLAGSESSNTKNTIYLTYTAVSSNGLVSTFSNNDVLTFGNGLTANVITSATSTGKGSIIRMGEGVLYTKGHFVRVPEQITVIGKYNSNTSLRVGYDVAAKFINADQDSSLLDPARGSFNFNAPGADRLKITATLTTKSFDDTSTSDFIEIIQVKNGNVIKKTDKPLYSQIDDYLARRTYNESGNYISSGHNLKVLEHLRHANNNGVFTPAEGGDSQKLAVAVSPGTAYVFGYERKSITTKFVQADKGIDFVDVADGTLTTNYGSFIVVNNFAGNFNISNHTTVTIYDQPQNAVGSRTFSGGSPLGAQIGTARVRAVEHVSGTKGTTTAQYRVYLYDVKLTGSSSFAAARSIFASNVTTANGKADIVTSANTAKLQELDFNTSLFELPVRATRRIRNASGVVDTSYQFNKAFDVTIAAAGSFTLNTGNVNERFIDTGLQSSTQKDEVFQVVLNETATSSANVATGSILSGANTITGVTNADTLFNVGETITIGSYANTFTITGANSTALTTHESSFATLSTQGIKKRLPPGTIINLNGVGGDGGNRIINVLSSTSASFDLQESFASGVDATVYARLNRASAREKAKVINRNAYVVLDLSSNPGGLNGPWNLGFADIFRIVEVRQSVTPFTTTIQGTEVTNQFTLDDGQKDNYYGLGSLKLRSSATISPSSGDFLLVKLDYFSEDTSQGSGYYSVDSYPIDDTNIANTNAIQTNQIPVFQSKFTEQTFGLRDCIDIRPRVLDTANNVTTLLGVTTNPSNTHSILESTGQGLRFPIPNETITFDYSYYLPRIDNIVINKEGSLRSVRGVPSTAPRTPQTPADSFSLGTLSVAPFPSTPSVRENGINVDVESYVNENRVVNYTMKDIGTLETRINNLEYYSSLNLLETSADSLNIPDQTGLNRFKSGFIVDNFDTYLFSDASNSRFDLLIDSKLSEGRARELTLETKLEHDVASSTNVVRSSGDVRLTLTTTPSAPFARGETVSSGSASGVLRYTVQDRMYIERVSGTWPSSGIVTGSLSGATATISAVKVYPDGELITLPYTHDAIIDATAVSGTRNAAGVAYTWEGILTLDPNQDFFIDTVRLPPNRRTVDITTNRERFEFGAGATQNARFQAAITRQWNAGRRPDPNTGRLSTPETSSWMVGFPTQRRTEQRVNISENVESTQTTNEPQPFIRAQTIRFTARGLKPNAVVYPFFDGVGVAQHTRGANASFANTTGPGGILQADSKGTLYGLFDLPNEPAQRFAVGTSTFRIIDNVGNNDRLGSYTTVAQAPFTATNTRQLVQETIVTTREIEQTDVVVFYDPLGQTFRVEDSLNEPSANVRQNPSNSPGMYLTKLDLFFATKDENLPCEIHIREVDPSSGFITPKILPFGKIIVPPEDINVNPTTPVPTPIYFDTPLYLLTDVDYAIVIKPAGGSPNYNVFVARMGETDIVTGNRIVANPYSGLLFISANDRNWQSVQDEDVTFRAYFANFGVNKTGTAAATTESLEYFKISENNTNEFITRNQQIHGETTLALHPSPTANVGESVVGGSTIATGILTGISSNNITVRDVSLTSKFTVGETLTFNFANGSPTGFTANVTATSTPTATIDYINREAPGGGRMTLRNVTGTFAANSYFKVQTTGRNGLIVENSPVRVDEAAVRFGGLELENTIINVSGKMATSSSTRDATFNSFEKNNLTYFRNPRFLVGENQEAAGLSGAKSGDFRFTLSNLNNNRHSPAIEANRMGLISNEFYINNLTTNETLPAGGDAVTRYLSTTVTLADGLDAEDLRVLVTAYKPAVANINVYVKLLNGEDSDTIENRPYIQLIKTTPGTINSSDEDRFDFLEFEYNLPSNVQTGPSGEVQYTSSGITYTGYKYFKIKIVLTTSVTSLPPRLFDMRAIALQV